MEPRLLSDWSVEALLDLLSTGSHETETFDLKEKLPDRRDDEGKTRLRKTCAAFANSDGGFIVFGVGDDRAIRPADRLVGLDPAEDFPERFGNFPRGCTPSLYWTFRNPPLFLGNGRVLHVVHIPRSWKAPHAIGDPSRGWHFVKRTNKGNEGMSMDEIRAAFLGFYEKRLKLQLLRSELIALRELAQSAYIADEDQIARSYSLVTLDTHVIESILSETYSITARETELLKALHAIRAQVTVASNKARILYGVAVVAMTGRNELLRSHNEFLEQVCQAIQANCDIAIGELDTILAE